VPTPTHVLNVAIVTNANMTSTITSTPINLDANDIVSFSIQASYTGSPSGTIELQSSNDNPTIGTPVVWTTITDSVASVSAAGTYQLNYDTPAFSWVQLVYIPNGGSGTLNARINGKRT
jgi:hypothetical protein